MKLFGKQEATTLVLGAAMLALVGNESASAEQVDAANQELDAAGIQGAQLVPGATLEELTTKAGRTDAAEAAQADADKKIETLEAKNTKLEQDLAAANLQADALGKKPGAEATSPVRADGKTDVEEQASDADQQAIDELPHNKALSGHPLFG